MGHFSMETYAPTGSNLSGNQHCANIPAQKGFTNADEGP
jgi:hypothetical protein